jgi:hypothetical protein
VQTLYITLIKYIIRFKDLRDSFIRAINIYILFKLSISVFRVFICILKNISFVKRYKGLILIRV